MSGWGEFVFVDESGDPGFPGHNAIYLLVACHMDERTYADVYSHLVAFRYFHGVNREFKDWGGLTKVPPTQQWQSFMGFLRDRSLAGDVAITCTWINKPTYRSNGGPHTDLGQSSRFRNFQLRRLLETHKARNGWGPNVDVILDRWSMSHEQRVNLETYIKTNWNLRPIGSVSTVNSAYVDMIQAVDLLTRLARKVIEGSVTQELHDLAEDLMTIRELRKGLF